MKEYKIYPKSGLRAKDFSYYELESRGPIEDLAKLNDFIEEELIPKFCNYRKKFNKNINNSNNQYHSSIALNKLTLLDLSLEEFNYTMNYLNDMGILVSGYDSDLIGLFENYEYFSSTTILNDERINKLRISKEETNLLLQEYMKHKDKNSSKAIKIRNRIIEGNLWLIPFTLKKIPQLDLRQDLLESYGYEGLLLCISKYNINLGVEFDTFAVECIRRHISKYLPSMLELSSYNNYRKFLNAKNKVERELSLSLGCKIKLIDHPEYLDLLFIEMGLGDMTLSKLDAKEKNIGLSLKRRINMLYNNFSEELENIINIEFNIEEYVDQALLEELIKEVLLELTEEERKLIFLRYGFDEKEKSYSEMACILGNMRETIRKRCIKVVKKLSKNEKILKLKK